MALHSQKDSDLAENGQRRTISIFSATESGFIGFIGGMAFLLPTKEVKVPWSN